MPRLSMDVVYGTVLFGVGAALFVSTWDPRYEGIGIGSDISPMFFPRLLLSLWLMLAAVITVRGLRAGAEGWPDRQQGRCAGVVVAVLAGTWAMTEVGFLFAMVPCFMVVSLLLGYRRAWPIVVLGVLMPLLTWFVFTELLELFLPTSPWFERV